MNPQTTTSPRSSKSQSSPLSLVEFAKRVLIAAGIGAIVIATLFLLWWSRSVFLLLFAGVVFGVFLHGLSDWLTRRTKLAYHWSLGVVVLLLLTILGLTGWLLGAQISSQFSQLAETLPQSFRQLQEQIERYSWGEWLIEKAQDGTALPNGQNIISRVTGIVGSALAGITGIVIIGFVGLYAAVNPGLYRKGILHLVPKPRRERGNEVLDTLASSLRNWLIAVIASMLAVGISTSLGLWLLGVPMFLALGLLAFFLVAIPNLGPVLATIPAVLVAWTHGGPTMGLQVLGLYLVVETLESYILLPLLQEETVDLPPVLSVIGVVFFGAIGGILGAFVAAPLLVVLMILVKMLYVEDVLDDHDVKGVGAED
jgi:predicted PurR-regulated permease PerM